jgi:hypothetical protein
MHRDRRPVLREIARQRRFSGPAYATNPARTAPGIVIKESSSSVEEEVWSVSVIAMVMIEGLDPAAGYGSFSPPRRARWRGGVVVHAEAGLSLAMRSRL